ncbi:MAG TPA: ATP-binding protein [Gemmatimonadales bacterium]
MTFRSRLLATIVAVAVIPLVVLALGVRREVVRRLEQQQAVRLSALTELVERELDGAQRDVAARLSAIRDALAGDNRFRLAVVQGAASERAYLLDLAGSLQRMSGLDVVRVYDRAGRILSSGHLRNEFDLVAPGLPVVLPNTSRGSALTTLGGSRGPFVALVQVDSLQLGDRTFYLVGGVEVNDRFVERMTPDRELAVALLEPAAGRPATAILWQRAMPFVQGEDATARVDTARWIVTATHDPLAAVRRGIDRWFGVALAGTAVIALAAAAWSSARISRPLRDLADSTAQLDLDRLDVTLGTDRGDEVGVLSRVLDAMTARLRVSAGRLREAERRATVGELARQVNHDVKNGLTPIRNVVRHLDEVARNAPGELPRVFTERYGTVESSIAYLEGLAGNYARLTPKVERRPCDINAIVREVTRDVGSGSRVESRLEAGLSLVRTDPLVLRRILENLVGNAADSLEEGGCVTVSTARVVGEGGDRAVRVRVADTGRGMTGAQLDRAFDDFYTTKERGTGLGLSIVRRLVADLGGTLKVQTAPGEGTVFDVDLPAETS